MRTVTGIITLAQEGRFQLVSDDGVAKLFMLAHGAPLEPQDLPALARAKRRVAVRYEQRPDLTAGIVHDIGHPEESRP